MTGERIPLLNDKLNNLNKYPFHMPGHKRNQKFNITGAEIDVTEITGLDDLHSPTLDIAVLENEIAKTWGYKKSIISVNGSTCGILAAIFAVCNDGDKIIIARNCHKSVYNACLIKNLNIEYIEPEYNKEFGVYTNVTQKAVDCALCKNPDAKAVVITSPTYEGFISEIKCNIPLIIDNAHGSHFGFSDWLPKKAQGDIVIQSFHKTLPSLTQTAVVHINNPAFFNTVKKYMDIFETSSPSYILLASVEKCCEYMKNCQSDFINYETTLDIFYQKAQEISGLNILNNDDKTRITISFDGYSGIELGEILKDGGIEPEGVTLNYVILISSIADEAKCFEKLLKILKKIKNTNNFVPFNKKLKIPKKICCGREIVETEITSLNKSLGKCCASMVYAYPPGIPIIVPGELIDSETLDYIELCIKSGVNIIDTDNLLPNNILTKA